MSPSPYFFRFVRLFALANHSRAARMMSDLMEVFCLAASIRSLSCSLKKTPSQAVLRPKRRLSGWCANCAGGGLEAMVTPVPCLCQSLQSPSLDVPTNMPATA